ncbi:hypothetical protein FIBSPDRAFT_964830 [Athelia psychrophila]|uniref:Uncharacterized protein n=1 Tax=Athelia psychrophila TaxID=1759441 RepID=A0A165XC54_9AGAM|nr:hypothetical protein FIBSPDRAFT_964830 [Fibularhizoctonia sp. CBS 109695]
MRVAPAHYLPYRLSSLILTLAMQFTSFATISVLFVAIAVAAPIEKKEVSIDTAYACTPDFCSW